MFAVLETAVEEQLHAEAYPEEWLARGDLPFELLVESAAPQRSRRVRKGAHAGQHDVRRVREQRPVRAYPRVDAEILERLLHAAQIAHSVIDDRDHSSTPLDEGISSETILTAADIALANALKIASALWWLFDP